MFLFVYIFADVTTAAFLELQQLSHFNALLLHLRAWCEPLPIYIQPCFSAQYDGSGFLWYNGFGSMYGGHLGILRIITYYGIIFIFEPENDLYFQLSNPNHKAWSSLSHV